MLFIAWITNVWVMRVLFEQWNNLSWLRLISFFIQNVYFFLKSFFENIQQKVFLYIFLKVELLAFLLQNILLGLNLNSYLFAAFILFALLCTQRIQMALTFFILVSWPLGLNLVLQILDDVFRTHFQSGMNWFWRWNTFHLVKNRAII